ncbi:hypothetical protein OE88DRAFT_346915 [Heliocybe sulcata]|uniref:Uncharacterized protein n=1 Tax=Heliocybe sulcata TaxID=5364 RepID=A0A5C3MX99_9AGAM|nr:hypothetical protein OE88DRAFT_346915 [Heliocybe sulcata]
MATPFSCYSGTFLVLIATGHGIVSFKAGPLHSRSLSCAMRPQCARYLRLAWCSLLLRSLIHYLICGVHGGTTLHYIDDNDGTPLYTDGSVDKWQAGQTCSACFAQPDETMTFQGTWHDGTYHYANEDPLSVSFQFEGTSLDVYCIIVNSVSYTTAMAVNFTLDGASAGNFAHSPNPSSPLYQYNVSVFSVSSIPSGSHQFKMTTSGNQDSLILFDYATYLMLPIPRTQHQPRRPLGRHQPCFRLAQPPLPVQDHSPSGSL